MDNAEVQISTSSNISGSKALLTFVDNKQLFSSVERVLKIAESAIKDADAKFFSNVIDPFSALFQVFTQKISFSDWMNLEKNRQIQKTLQNSVGEFHQQILGSVPGWENLQTGSVVDIRNKKRKIIAEVKNKFNTTKGNHKKEIYDDLLAETTTRHKGYVSYYVETIPNKRAKYDKPFMPPDNVKKSRRPENNKIRIIDGYSFYEMVTGEKNALRSLYNVLPVVIGQILKVNPTMITKDPHFIEFFEKAFTKN